MRGLGKLYEMLSIRDVCAVADFVDDPRPIYQFMRIRRSNENDMNVLVPPFANAHVLVMRR